MNRLLFCEPWLVSNFAVVSRSIPLGNHFTFYHASTFARRGSLLVVTLALGARFCRGLGNRLLGGGLFRRGLLRSVGRLVVAICRRGGDQFLSLRPRADG